MMKPPSVNEVDPEANKMNLSAINTFSVFWKLAVPATVKSPVMLTFWLNIELPVTFTPPAWTVKPEEAAAKIVTAVPLSVIFVF